MRVLAFCTLVGIVAAGAPHAAAGAPPLDLKGARIVLGPRAQPLEVLAARELQRYLGLIGGGRCRIETAAPRTGPAILLGTPASSPAAATALRGARVGDEGFVLRTLPARRLLLAAGTPRGVLWAAYALLERLGVGFYLGGDALAGAGPPEVPADLNVLERPAFRVRGSLPWYNFLDSPTTWDRDDFRSFFDQMAKMRMNFVGFHSYDSEPFCAYEYAGKVTGAEPLVTAHTYGWGTVQGLSTGEFGFGTGDFFSRPEFGSKPATQPGTREQRIQRAQALLADGLNYARSRGLKVCVGFEVSGDPTLAENQERLAARLGALLRAYPMLDYVWIWQSEGLGGGSEVPPPGSQLALAAERYADQFGYLKEPTRVHEAVRVMVYTRLAHDLLKRIAPKVRMVVSGWGGDRWMRFSDFYLGLDRTVPPDVVFAALDNIDPSIAPTVADAYGKLSPGRERWPIPWWESDGGYTRRDQWGPQCNARPFVPLCRDALAKGCQGMLAIHWRTRDVEEAAAYQAQFAWDPSLSYETFFDGFARRCYGAPWASEMGGVHRDLEALGPRYTGTSGQVECGGFEWFSDGKLPSADNLAKLAALRARIASVRQAMTHSRRTAGLARIDWLLTTIDWLTRYDAAALVLRPAGPVDRLLGQAEEAAGKGDAARARELASEAAAAFRACGLAQALQTFPWKMTTCGEWGSLATINVKAYAAYRQIAQRIRAAGGDPGTDDRALPLPAEPRIVMRTPPSIVEPGKPVEVSAIVAARSPKVSLEYRAAGEPRWRQAPMRNTFRRTWTAAIPGAAVTAGGIQYRVTAAGSSGAAASPTFSASGLAMPAAPVYHASSPPAPGPVTALSAHVAPDYEVRLRWTPPYRSTACLVTRDPAEPGVFPVRTRLTELSDVTVAAGTTYRYTVAALDRNGKPGATAAATVEVPRGAPPAPPTQVTARPGAGKVRLSWQAAPGRVRGYRIYRSRAGGPMSAAAGPVAATTYLDTRAGADEELTYRIAAVDRGGQESEPSAPVSARALPRPTGPAFAAPLDGSAGADGQVVSPAAFTTEVPAALDTRRGGYAVYPHRSAFDIEGEFAVSLRIRPASVDAMPVIASCGEFQKQGWFVQILGGGVRFSLGGDNVLDAGRVVAGKWTRVTCTYDGERMRVYLDGREAGSRLAPAVEFRPWPGPMYVGQYHFLQEPYQFRGLLRDLRVYQYAPTAEEVARYPGD